MRILITGQCTLHWGRMEFGNIGNYYILEPFVRELHRNFPGAEVVTTFQLSDEFCKRENITTLPMAFYYNWSGDDLPKALEELALATLYNQYGFLPKTTPYIDAVKESDLVIDFSGDIWGDNADLLGDDRFLVGLCKDRVAQLLKKPTAMLAGSPGPFSGRVDVNFVKDVFSGFDLVTNREAISTKLLEAEGFDTKRLKTLACPAFLFEPSKDKAKIDTLLKEAGLDKNKEPLVGFVLCGWNFLTGPFDKWPRPDKDYTVFAEAIEYIVNQLGAKVVVMSHSNGFDIPPAPFKLKHGRDYPIVKQLQKVVEDRGKIPKDRLASLDGIYPPAETKAIISRFDFMVSGRIHAAVAGMSQFVPTVIIDYGHEPKAHKLRGFAEVAEMGRLIADPAKSQDLVEKIQYGWENKSLITKQLSESIPRVQNLARENFAELKKLVEHTERP